MRRVDTAELRTRFAQALSAMYDAEVPAYRTLVEVATQVNREYLSARPGADRLGSAERVSAERHGAIRAGTVRELADLADLFAAFGMYPVGFYDLRDAAPPVPVLSTAFRPIDADELARNPFRVFTSMLATADGRFFEPHLRRRMHRFLSARELFDPALIAEARRIAAHGGTTPERAAWFVDAAVAVFALRREPIDKTWCDQLARVSAVAADIAGLPSTHINHLTPRVLDIDELHRRMTARGITMIGAIHGPRRWDGRDVLLRQTSFRAPAEPRRFRHRDGSVTRGTLRFRFGEVEARGVALTPKGRQRYDEAMTAADLAVDGLNWQAAAKSVWPRYFPATDWGLAADGLAYYRQGDPTQPIVYEDFLPRSNLDSDAVAGGDPPDTRYNLDWMSGAIGHHIHDPYTLYEKAAQ
jgi:uncharacterized glyoxalase superfamily metalloenzyme YdcJ